jgi:phage N-6-adenine-methyltransferase
MTINQGMFSSATDDWATPQWLFDKLDAVFGFNVDVCASSENSKCATWFSKEFDGLGMTWIGTCWMNPPYGRDIMKWVEKAHKSSIENGATVVCLLPARTDTKWWHEYVAKASEIHFIRGRLKFGGSTNSAPFPSAVVVFRPTVASILGGHDVRRNGQKVDA